MSDKNNEFPLISFEEEILLSSLFPPLVIPPPKFLITQGEHTSKELLISLGALGV